VQQGFVYHGHTYGFAKDYSTLALWYNKDLFKSAGISKPPTTWAALQSDACKLSDKSAKRYGISFSADPARWLAFVYQAGGSLLNKNQTSATINSSASKKALDYYAGMVKRAAQPHHRPWAQDGTVRPLAARIRPWRSRVTG
jgi:multiple sugar transport system substrate-binding protein